MTPKFSVATLLYTTDYLPGVFTLGYQLKKLLRERKDIETCLVISRDLYNRNISELTKSLLRKLYDVIVEVDPLNKQDESIRRNAENLGQLNRPELSFTLIKARLWELTQFDQVLYLDGDTLPLSEDFLDIFNLVTKQKSNQIGGAPDIGWPDMFNSGVLLLAPDKDLASRLQKFILDNTSIDGADQGILNQFFNPFCGSNGDKSSFFEWIRLPFLYNVTMPNYGYQSSPAIKFFKSQIKLVHFIGENKPWKGWLSRNTNGYFTQWNKVFREFQEEYDLVRFLDEIGMQRQSPGPLWSHGTANDSPSTSTQEPDEHEEKSNLVDWEKFSRKITQGPAERAIPQDRNIFDRQIERAFSDEIRQSGDQGKAERVFPKEQFQSNWMSKPSSNQANELREVPISRPWDPNGKDVTERIFPVESQPERPNDTSLSREAPVSSDLRSETVVNATLPKSTMQSNPEPDTLSNRSAKGERVFPDESEVRKTQSGWHPEADATFGIATALERLELPETNSLDTSTESQEWQPHRDDQVRFSISKALAPMCVEIPERDIFDESLYSPSEPEIDEEGDDDFYPDLLKTPSASSSKMPERVFPEDRKGLKSLEQNSEVKIPSRKEEQAAGSKIGRQLELIKGETEEETPPTHIFDWEDTDYLQKVERSFPTQL